MERAAGFRSGAKGVMTVEPEELNAGDTPVLRHPQEAWESRAERPFQEAPAEMPEFVGQGLENLGREQKFREEVFDLFVEFFCRERAFCLKSLVANLEKNIILNVLQTAHGNQREAARLLGIKYTTLNEKIKRYKIRFRITPIPYPF